MSRNKNLNAIIDQAYKGDAKAQCDLGLHYLCDAKSRILYFYNLSIAVFWIKKSAEQGYRGAQYALGMMHKSGRGVKQDMDAAVVLLTKAAEQSLPSAQYELGRIYFDGKDGIKKDIGKGIGYFQLAAFQGFPDALVDLGKLEETGQAGLKQSYCNAAQRYIKAALLGSDQAKECLRYLAGVCLTKSRQGQEESAPADMDLANTKNLLESYYHPLRAKTVLDPTTMPPQPPPKFGSGGL